MGLHQGLEASLFMPSNRFWQDLSEVETQGLGQGPVERLYALAVPGVAQSRGQLRVAMENFA
jgi:hypothetical protein